MNCAICNTEGEFAKLDGWYFCDDCSDFFYNRFLSTRKEINSEARKIDASNSGTSVTRSGVEEGSHFANNENVGAIRHRCRI